MMKKTMQMMTAALLLVSGLVTAGEVKLPEPQSGLIVLPKGIERKAYPGSAFLGGGMKDAVAEVGLSWNDKELVAVFDCKDESIVAVQGDGRDNPMSWKDDAVELLLDPGHQHGVPTLVRVSAAGALWDAKGTDSSYNIPGVSSRVVHTENGWRATMVVPWEGLGVKAPVDGEIWGLNLRHINQTGSYKLETMQEAGWAPVPHLDVQDVMLSGHMAFVLPETLEDDTRLARMRQNVADGQAQAIRGWAGPNDGDVITLDGKPVTIAQLGRTDSGVPPRQATRVTIDRTADALLVSFDCEDRDISGTMEGRDNFMLWKDDSVYVWLDPAHSHAREDMIMLQVSAAATITDGRGGDNEWNLEGLVADVKKTDRGWTAQLTIPFKGLGVETPKNNTIFGLNLSRMDQPGKYEYSKMQTSSLATIPGGDLGAMHRWGHLAFGKAVDPAKTETHIARKQTVDAKLAADAAADAAEQKRLRANWGLPANPNASEDVHKIVAWLCQLPQRKEKRLIVGQCAGRQERYSYEYGNPSEIIYNATKNWPGMLHFGFNDQFSSWYKSDPDCNKKGVSMAIKFWQEQGGLVHFFINPVNPWNKRHIFEPDKLAGRERITELLTPGTEGNTTWMAILDEYAARLTELRDAGVVVVWRPLHEMGFKSMYWYDAGATPDREVFKDIWRHMFRYFTYEKKLDNLIWAFGAGGGPAAYEMYPGPDYVDLVGFSNYGPGENVFNNEYKHTTHLGKPFAFTEFGNYAGSKPGDALNLVRAVRERYPLTTFAVYWGSWHRSPASLPDSDNMVKLMNHPWALHTGNLDWKDTKVDLEKSRARKVQHKEFEFRK